MTGLETCVNITTMEKALVWDKLKDQPTSNRIHQLISSVMLRARYNRQRHYEVYTMQVEDGLTETDIREMFELDPQGSADIIRDRGYQIYSDRVNQETQRIV